MSGPAANQVRAEGEEGSPEFLAELRRAGELLGAQRLPEAESEAVRALARAPRDLRALKLVALVRFKLGRLPEARDAYREAAEVAPQDAAVRLNLGLIALKLDDFGEAVAELETTTGLRPDDKRAWSYLGYACARTGAHARAAEAFRRAGQEELAAEMDRAARPPTPTPPALPVAVPRAPTPPTGVAIAGAATAALGGTLIGLPGVPAPGDTVKLRPDVLAPPPAAPPPAEEYLAPAAEPSADEAPPPPIEPAAGSVPSAATPPPLPAPLVPVEEPSASVPASTWALERLVASDPTATPVSWAGEGVLRFAVHDEAHVRESALMASSGSLDVGTGSRRQRGRTTLETLETNGDRMLRCRGIGELWLSLPTADRTLVALGVEEDVLYVREDRVIAFDGEVVWESGRTPWDGTPLLQFRGTGRVVIAVGPDELRAFAVREGTPLAVAPGRVVGWLGRLVAQSAGGAGAARIACEGEGVLLVSRHATDPAQSVHERAEPGDHGAGAPGAGGPVLHR